MPCLEAFSSVGTSLFFTFPQVSGETAISRRQLRGRAIRCSHDFGLLTAAHLAVLVVGPQFALFSFVMGRENLPLAASSATYTRQ
jgi:hypothetical protein